VTLHRSSLRVVRGTTLPRLKGPIEDGCRPRNNLRYDTSQSIQMTLDVAAPTGTRDPVLRLSPRVT
jgi:hypothetical protein